MVGLRPVVEGHSESVLAIGLFTAEARAGKSATMGVESARAVALFSASASAPRQAHATAIFRAVAAAGGEALAEALGAASAMAAGKATAIGGVAQASNGRTLKLPSIGYSSTDR